MRITLTKPIAVAALALGLAIAPAATFNNSVGMGASSGNATFTGVGVPLAVQGSVISNSIYYITSANAGGAARIESVWMKSAALADTLDFYVATNSWVCASNQPAGTNYIWLTTTNSTMRTNDYLVICNKGYDAYQLMICGSAAGTLNTYGTAYTNAAGYVAIEVYNTPTNVISAGDTIYKMAKVLSLTPLTMHNVTNDVANPIGQWFPLATKNGALTFSGFNGTPAMLILSGADIATTNRFVVSGQYIRRPF